jgi:protein-S-isoprenylcysteine O-methyltransferase Ste14
MGNSLRRLGVMAIHRVRRFKVPGRVLTRQVAVMLLAIGVIIVVLSLPNWMLIAFGVVLAIAGWLLYTLTSRSRRRRW